MKALILLEPLEEEIIFEYQRKRIIKSGEANRILLHSTLGTSPFVFKVITIIHLPKMQRASFFCKFDVKNQNNEV